MTLTVVRACLGAVLLAAPGWLVLRVFDREAGGWRETWIPAWRVERVDADAGVIHYSGGGAQRMPCMTLEEAIEYVKRGG